MKRRREAGQVLPLIAVMLGILMGFGGISVDVGYLKYQQQAQQNATDAAALGGAQQLVRSNCGNPGTAISGAYADATTNGYTSGSNVTVTAHSPPTSGPYSGNACAISVTIQSQHVATFFSRLFGYPQGATETTQATGAVSSNGGGCIYMLSNNTWSSFNNATVYAPGCPIAINFTASFNQGTITSPSIGYAGGNPNLSNTVFPEAAPAPMLPIADPCPQIPGCAYLAANPPPATNCQTYNQNGIPGSISPGCYQNLNLNARTTFNPGTYVISGNFNDNGAIITGTGVTIYVTASGNAPNWDNQSVSLSPPTTGNYAGVLYYQVPSNSSGMNFNGPNVNLSGLIYAPNSNSVNFDGANGNYVVLVVGSANFNQNAAYDFASPPPGQALVKHAVLAQ